MIIKNVVINNFFCFLDRNELEFKKGLNIISSPNSGGKSQLFNALYWTFFDKVYIQNDNNTNKAWRSAQNVILCPDAYSKNDSYNGKITTFVEIIIEAEKYHDDDETPSLTQYTFYKSVSYEKQNKSVSTFSKAELVISYVEDGETKIIPTAEHTYLLDKIFPESIRRFMWYQGETMDELYDFNQPQTLKYAIKEISYYPIYDNMEKIVKSSLSSIETKIEKVQRQNKSLTAEQGRLLNQIKEKKDLIKSKEQTINNYNQRISHLNEELSLLDEQLKNSEKHSELRNQLLEKDYKHKEVVSKIEALDTVLKTKLVSKWMLAGCNNIIEASEVKLEILNAEIQKYSKTTNPVPMSLPGPEYIERMLEDKICYICEREVSEPSSAYEALKKRLDDFEKSAHYKQLQDNYTDLNRSKRNVLDELAGVKKEIEDDNRRKGELLALRKSAYKELQSLYKSSGSDSANIISRGNSVDQLLSKHKVFRAERESKMMSVRSLNSDIYRINEDLKLLEAKLESKMPAEALNIVESVAKKYVELFVNISEVLNKEAYKKFISDLQNESNKLYSSYLGGNPQGEIVINDGIQIVDFQTKDILFNLNTAEEVAQKLAVANSFLSLSEKVKNKSYPIIADAPTSDFDPINTINLTMNIGKSFEQMIILSKDYTSLSEKERNKLIKDANIQKYYEFKFDTFTNKINGDPKTRISKKTFINAIK